MAVVVPPATTGVTPQVIWAVDGVGLLAASARQEAEAVVVVRPRS